MLLPYTQTITRSHRTAFVLLIDASGSMSERITFSGGEVSKAEAVASITNSLLYEVVERARRDDGVRDYYDISVLGYSGDDEVYSLLQGGQESLPVSLLARCEVAMQHENLPVRLPDGSLSLREIRTPQWVVPHAAGQTPMCEALRRTRDLLKEWCARPEHRESFPPVVYHITDGEATDGDADEVLEIARQIKALQTDNGHVLLINIHLSAMDSSRQFLFPSADEIDSLEDRYLRLLYDCASELPEYFEPAIRRIKRENALAPFRGLCFNVSAAELLSLLNIGSISLRTE